MFHVKHWRFTYII